MATAGAEESRVCPHSQMYSAILSAYRGETLYLHDFSAFVPGIVPGKVAN
jgi:hypothetical protein